MVKIRAHHVEMATNEEGQMLPTLGPGIEHEVTYTVSPDMGTKHIGTPVFSTPAMVGLIVSTCLDATAAQLDDHETTVGIHIALSHQAPARVGEEVTVSCRLTTVERRILTFDVTVKAGDRVLGEGTHQRAVIDTRKFG